MAEGDPVGRRLRAPAGCRLDDLLRLGLSIDVWQRQDDAFVAVVTDKALRELERRRLADVERISTAAEYEERARKLSSLRREPRRGGLRRSR